MLPYHRPHGLHAHAQEGPVPIGFGPTARAPPTWLKPTANDVKEHIYKLANLKSDFLTNLCDLRDSHVVTQVCFVKAINLENS